MLDLEKKLKELQGKTIKVGVPASTAPYEDGISTAVIAAVHEYGSLTRRIPARPFLRPGVANAIPKINKLLQIKLPDFVSGSINADGVFTLVGEIARSEIVRMWDNNNWTPLKSQSAQKAVEKGDRQILLDTGHLKNSITYQVI